MKNLLFLLLFIALGCGQDAELKQRLDDAEASLLIAEKDLQDLQESLARVPEANLIHVVYLNLKEDISSEQKKELVAAIDDLAKINEVDELELGNFADLGDVRALSEFEMVFSMAFLNKSEYEVYQAHPIHLRLKKIAEPMLEGPPVTYDYLR